MEEPVAANATEYTDSYVKLMSMKMLGRERWDKNLLFNLINESELATKIFSAREPKENNA